MKPRGRVLLVTDNLQLGGVQQVVVQLAQCLAERGQPVAVIAAPIGDLWEDLPPSVAKMHPPTPDSLLSVVRYIRWIRRVLRQGDGQVLHSHQRRVSLLCRIASIGSGVSVVEHVHNSFQSTFWSRILSFRGHRLIACGSAIQRMLVEDFRRDPKRVVRIVNGVGDSWTTAQTGLPFNKKLEGGARELRTPADVLRIVAIGRLAEQKDPLAFVELISALGRHGVAVQATWVGDGPLRGAMEECARELKTTQVRLVGSQRNVTPYLESADLLVMTSRREGLPLVILEAMAAGRAVVAPDIGSCADAVVSGVTGMLYPPGIDSEHLVLAIASMLERHKLEELGAAGRSRYLDLFTLDKWVQAVERVYDEVQRK